MDPILKQLTDDAEKNVLFLKEELKAIRTGKAHASLIENLTVEAYGGQSKLRLMELATILAEGASFLSVTPFDPSTTQDIERAILKSPLGISPLVQGNKIMIKVPTLSEEQRMKMTKLVGEKVEEKKGQLRNLRDSARKKIKQLLESKTITEDDKFRMEKEVDSVAQKLSQELDTIKQAKEKDIMEV